MLKDMEKIKLFTVHLWYFLSGLAILILMGLVVTLVSLYLIKYAGILVIVVGLLLLSPIAYITGVVFSEFVKLIIDI